MDCNSREAIRNIFYVSLVDDLKIKAGEKIRPSRFFISLEGLGLKNFKLTISTITIVFTLYKQCCHPLKAWAKANSSFSYVDCPYQLPPFIRDR